HAAMPVLSTGYRPLASRPAQRAGAQRLCATTLCGPSGGAETEISTTELGFCFRPEAFARARPCDLRALMPFLRTARRSRVKGPRGDPTRPCKASARRLSPNGAPKLSWFGTVVLPRVL